MCIYIFFFIHSSINEHLGCFHVLAIVNYASVNISVHVSFQISVSLSSDKPPEVELVGPSLSFVLCFKVYLSDISIAIPVSFAVSIFRKYLFHLYFQCVCFSFKLESHGGSKRSCFIIHSVTLCLYNGALHKLASKVIIDRYVLTVILFSC